jgi:F-type H+-transporting ATPase subunit delta
MKITANQYAKTLYELTQGKAQDAAAVSVANFAKFLSKNGQTKLFLKISQKFSEIWNQKEGIIEAEITSWEKLSEDNLKKTGVFLKEKYTAKEVVLKNKVDPKLKGGVVIRVGDEILDGSVANQLKKLKNNLIQ